MKEFTEKLISRLEEESYDMEICEEQFDMNRPYFKDVPYKMLKLEDVKTIISQFAEEYVPNTNVGNKDGWISVDERLPEEHDSIFKARKGTDKWKDAMFEKISDEVIVTVEYENGERRTKTTHTIDGEWNTGQSIVPFKVIAWQPLPATYKEKGE